MTKNKVGETKYECFNDCQQMGCPGHTLTFIHDICSDIFIFEIDGKPEYYFDENMFRAMVELSQV